MDVLFAGIPVSDLARAVDWYTRLFGRPPDIVPNQQEVMWQVTDSGWLYVLDDADRAGGSVVTIAVSDLDAAVADIATRGISGDPVERVGDAGRKAKFGDPDGNQVALIQVS
jgi:predicted enzyme related to lactoylglutathione lyase